MDRSVKEPTIAGGPEGSGALRTPRSDARYGEGWVGVRCDTRKRYLMIWVGVRACHEDGRGRAGV